MPTRGRTGAAPSSRSVAEVAEVRVRKPRARATAASSRKPASSRTLIPPPEPAPEAIPESIPEAIPEAIPESIPKPISEQIPEPISGQAPVGQGAEPVSALLPASPEPVAAPLSIEAPVAAVPVGTPPLDALTAVQRDIAALRAELLAQSGRDEAARTGTLTQALRLATAAAHHLDKVSAEVGQVTTQVRSLSSGLKQLAQRQNERDAELRAARAEQQRDREEVRGMLTDLGQRLFQLNLRANEDQAMSRKSSAELMHEVQRLLRAVSLPHR